MSGLNFKMPHIQAAGDLIECLKAALYLTSIHSCIAVLVVLKFTSLYDLRSTRRRSNVQEL